MGTPGLRGEPPSKGLDKLGGVACCEPLQGVSNANYLQSLEQSFREEPRTFPSLHEPKLVGTGPEGVSWLTQSIPTLVELRGSSPYFLPLWGLIFFRLVWVFLILIVALPLFGSVTVAKPCPFLRP